MSMLTRALAWCVRPFYRKPDFLIGGTADDPYMRRWWVIPRNTRANIYLHHFRHDDDDRAAHDHPWASLSIMLCGHLRELYLDAEGREHWRELTAPSVVFRSATFSHRLEVVRPAWTIFMTGRVVREWGFHCPLGWRHWKEFVAPSDKGAVGRGCE